MRAEQILPDGTDHVDLGNGVRARKGSVTAFLANASLFEQPCLDDDARAALLDDLRAGLPALSAMRLFDVFEIRNPALRVAVNALLDEQRSGLE